MKIKPMRLSAGGPVHPGSQVQRLNLRGHLILDDELIPVLAIHRSGLRDLDMALRATFACCSQVCATCSWRDLSHNLKHLDQVVPESLPPRTPRCVCSGSATTLQPIILYVRAYPADRIATLTLPLPSLSGRSHVLTHSNLLSPKSRISATCAC